MTLVKVVDASAVAAILFNEPAAAQMRDRILDSRPAAPRLLRYELASIAFKKVKLKRLDMTWAQQLLDQFSLWDLLWYDPSPTKVFETAARTGLSAYDAAYLWLAGDLRAELVTLDAEMERAFKT